MASQERNLANREWLFKRLHAELIGPDSAGDTIEISSDGSTLLKWEDFRKPKKQTNGQEILWQDPPIKRYGAGVLFPLGITELKQMSEEANSTPGDAPEEGPGEDVRVDEVLEKKASKKASRAGLGIDDSDEQDVNLANSYRPSAMGLSFLADLSGSDSSVKVLPSFASYERKTVRVGESNETGKFTERDLWLRKPGLLPDGSAPVVSFSMSELLQTKEPLKRWVPGFEGKLQVVVVMRRHDSEKHPERRLLTVSVVNRQGKNDGRVDEHCFFQCGFKVTSDDRKDWILPYPEVKRVDRQPSDEEEVIRLLYRNRLTFGVGHGCSAEWVEGRPSLVSQIWTDCLPRYETPATSADLFTSEGKPIRVSMRKLSGLDATDDGKEEIELLISSYSDWIRDLKDLDGRKDLDGSNVPVTEDLKETAKILIHKCELCRDRILRGVEFLKEATTVSATAREAFQLANRAMLIAQLRASREVRTPSWENGQLVYDKPIANPDPSAPHAWKGYWRAFQIAFLLMSIPGICMSEDDEKGLDEREIVDLIWFPTGGGKTEAYLGLTAFTIFFNRLSGRKPGGTDVLMRYTLRLLTAQQFQRAALLFCAMEHLRKNHEWHKRLGDKPFRLGMWVGGDATPNKRESARSALSNLQRNPDSENPFVLLKCPWCNAKFGPGSGEAGAGGRRGRGRGGRSRQGQNVYGYKHLRRPGQPDTVAFRCDDYGCEFGDHPVSPKDPLPIIIIDEDLYDETPNLIIGTVDKFAMLAWKPEARALFGIGSDGRHIGVPPSLIIQDELHLISGPLGSMVGAYETVIEELCIQDVDGKIIRPKIVASTATISRAEDQVRALYARDDVMLFPPSGLEASDSFFAREDRNSDGALKPGRMYVGIMAPGHGSLQTTEARVFATLLQYPAIMPVADGDETERDPWWTLLCFFNSLRELGGAATLLVSDARDYLRVLLNRHGIDYKQIRQLLNCEELTSRIRSDHIPLAIQKLEQPFQRDDRGYVKDTVETCLASNIIEVGVDIDRLSLMAIIGQPKTTSQYIQVSSRVGRNMAQPGLVNVLYSQSKPRDRSHFERFRAYHQRLYAQVEPTSVTPFSPPAIDRALHGIIVATVRQLGDMNSATNPRPFPLGDDSGLRKRVEQMILERVQIVDDEEINNTEKMMLRRLKEWLAWDPKDYGGFGPPPEDAPLIHPAGSQEPLLWAGRSWPTLSSLRNVDASCEAEVTAYFNLLQQEDSQL